MTVLKKKATKEIIKKEPFNELDSLKKKLVQEEKNLKEQQEKVKLIKSSIFSCENEPFKEGSHVIMEVPQGRTKKECECVLSVVCDYGEYSFKATPIKEDGTLSGRSFKVYQDTKLKLA